MLSLREINVIKAYSKLWNSLVQAQNFFFQSMNTPELERRFSRMDVCLDFNLSIGQARYFEGKVAIPSPKIEKFLPEKRRKAPGFIHGDIRRHCEPSDKRGEQSINERLVLSETRYIVSRLK